MEMKVKVKCPRCGAVTYKPSLEGLLREVKKLWEPWREYLTIEQRKKLEEYNNFARLEAILAEKGYINMFCPICVSNSLFQLLLRGINGNGGGNGGGEMSEITVVCPKENKEVPIWYCLGSFIQQREPCPHLIEARVNFPKKTAEVKCKISINRS